MDKSFEELIAEAGAVDVAGWDFSWLDGRATEERPPWGYQKLMGERIGRAALTLDIQTGGGEVLAGVPQRAGMAMVATESWPPNIQRAQENLRGKGVVVVADEAGRRCHLPTAPLTWSPAGTR